MSRETTPKKKIFTTQEIVLTGMFAAILTVISQLSIPMPSGVPITIQLFGVVLVGVVLSWKLGVTSVLVYVLLGAIGLPIFANFQGGIAVLVGMTGGYIMGWPITALLSGIAPKTGRKGTDLAVRIILVILGVLYCETVGGLQWAHLSGDMGFGAIMIYSLGAFIPKDIVISIAAMLVGIQIRKPLLRAGYLR